MGYETRIDFDDIADNETINDVQNNKAFKTHGQDWQRDECTFEDDPKRQQRIIKVKPRRSFFFLGG